MSSFWFRNEQQEIPIFRVAFQTDLELRNAQLSRLLNWLKQEQSDIYPQALALVEATLKEFERRVQE